MSNKHAYTIDLVKIQGSNINRLISNKYHTQPDINNHPEQ